MGWKVAVAVVGLGAGLLAGGCSTSETQSQGPNKDVTATYSWRTLKADLPEQTRVPAVIAAADETLRARGYTVEKSSATEEMGEIIAHAPRYNDYPRLVLTSKRGASGTSVALVVEPFGDQELCRSVLDGVLQRMGL